MSKHLIVGTAGHIDHGKTTLIRSLTGIDTDRLKEEKERGITIELGFGSLKLPGGTLLGVVDVPGHEKFVRHMVAGAAGIDLVMLVIAADEGIMPQTREHLDICRMLGIRRGLIVLTKADLCDREWIDLVAEEVQDFVKGTFLDGAPIVPVSSVSGDGLPELLAELDQLVTEIPARSPYGAFRLPVDRVFTMKGFGTVVTGTTASGTVHVGDEVTVYPRALKTRVRGLQVHNAAAPEVEAGFRTALNLQGLEKNDVDRGDVIGHPGELTPSYILDVRLQLLSSAPRKLRDKTRVRFHLGTAEILARVHLLEGDDLEPGKDAWAQIRLEKPTVALARDRFVIRSYSPSLTVGGGAVIDPMAAKHTARRRNIAAILERLASLERGSPQEVVLVALQNEGSSGGTAASLARTLNMEAGEVSGLLSSLASEGAAIPVGDGPRDLFLAATALQDLAGKVNGILESFHRSNPLKSGLSREELKTKLPRGMPPRMVAFLLERLEQDGAIVAKGNTVRSASHRATLDARQQRLRDSIESILTQARLAVPSPAEMEKNPGCDRRTLLSLLELMTDEGTLVKIHDDIYLHAEVFRDLKNRIADHFAGSPELTVGDFKEMTGLSRRYSIPILEFLDRTGVTLRVGDRRMLKK